MKRTLSLITAALLTLGLLAGCTGQTTPVATEAPVTTEAPAETEAPVETEAPAATETPYEPVDIRIGGLKGPTSMGIVQLMEAAEEGTAQNNYTFTIAGSADELTPKLIQGELDMAMVPANLAAVLYNNTQGAVKLLAVNTLGVIYIVEKGEEVTSLADLKGRTLYATGKGSTPEYALRYLLTENGIDPDTDLTIEWKSEPTEVVAVLAQEDGAVAMLPQPYVTVTQTQVEGLRVAVDLTQVWDALDNGSQLITGVLAVRADFAEAHPEQLAAFLAEYKASVEYVNANTADAAQLIEKFDIVKAAIAEKALPYCNITFLAGEDMVAPMKGYLQVLFDQNPKAVGGTLPADDFYYVG